MEWLIAICIGVMTASGVYLTLRPRTFPVVLGLTLLAYAVNVFLFAMGRFVVGQPAIIDENALGYADPLPQALVLTAIIDENALGYADPLPQALVLTAIVIAFGMTAFLIVLALKARGEIGNDHVDGLHRDDEEKKTR